MLKAFVSSAFVVLLFCFFAGESRAQSIVVGVNGLTCSQCSRSVENKLKALSFVDSVQMDLAHTNGRIVLKKNITWTPEQIAKAVAAAGFSVRNIKLMIDEHTRSEKCFDLMGLHVQVIDTMITSNLPINNYFVLLGDGFMPKADMKRWQKKMKKTCAVEGPVYYVVLSNFM